MSPEFKIRLEMAVDLPSEEAAHQMADGLKQALIGVTQIQVEAVRMNNSLSKDLYDPTLFEELDFGQTLKFLRETVGVSQSDLSRITGIERAILNRMENFHSHNGRMPRVRSVYKVANALGLPDDDPITKMLLEKRSQIAPS